MKRNSKPYYRDRCFDDDWIGDDDGLSLASDEDLFDDADLEDEIDENVDE